VKHVGILEDADTIRADDWCRPLTIVSMMGGHSDYYSFTSEYSGQPENNAEWVHVHQIFGEPWFGETVGTLLDAIERPYEFVRGDIPERSKYGMTNRDKKEENERRLQKIITFGKHKGKTWSFVKQQFPDYYSWAERKGLIPRLLDLDH